jgi:hypothetical protein
MTDISGTASRASAEALALLKRSPGKRPEFFPDRGVDQLFSLVLELATELWVLRERVYAIEDVAGKHGLPLRDALESWKPTAGQTDELARLRHEMLQQLFRTIDRGAAPDSTQGHLADPQAPQRSSA